MINKAIILDIDGTIVDSPKELLPSKRLIKAVAKIKQTHKVVIATGRPWYFAKGVINALGIEEPCIITAGTQICIPKTGEIITQRSINPKDITKLSKILADEPNLKAVWNSFTADDYINGYKSIKSIDINKEYFVVALVYLEPNYALEIIEKLKSVSGIVASQVISYKKGLIDLHITSSNATKEHAIEDVLKLIDINKSNTIGVGDGGNDTHLFAAVGYKIAMGNAAESLKAKADTIIKSVQEEGLAEYLELLASQ